MIPKNSEGKDFDFVLSYFSLSEMIYSELNRFGFCWKDKLDYY